MFHCADLSPESLLPCYSYVLILRIVTVIYIRVCIYINTCLGFCVLNGLKMSFTIVVIASNRELYLV